MKLQVCSFREKHLGEWKVGVACVDDFHCCDVQFILNDQGNRVKKFHDFRLETPVAFGVIDTEFRG